MADPNTLKVLTNRREYVFREIQILYDLSREIQNDKSKINAFKVRFSRVETIRNEYLEVTQSINELLLKINPDTDISTKSLAAFDDLYYEVLIAAESHLPKTRGSGVDDRSAADGPPAQLYTYSAKPTSTQALLPKIELPKFHGNIEYWQTFYDTYVSLVHDNENISSIEKFHYLISCLGDSALSIAKGVPVTADNYQIVFNALVDRYENKRILAITYLDKIYNFQQVKTNNFNELRKYTNLLNESVNALKAMKLENLGEFILFYLASRNLDSDTRKRFETQNKTEIPTIVELLSFLHNYVKVIEVSGTVGTTDNWASSIQQKQNLSKPSNRTGNNWRFNNNNAYKAAALPTSTQSLECFCCGLPHTIYRCTKFLSLVLKDRLNFISSKNMCANCLRPNHTESQCFSRTSCTLCGARHHTLLHRDQASQGHSSGINSNQHPPSMWRVTQNHHQASDNIENEILPMNYNNEEVESSDLQLVDSKNLCSLSSPAVEMCSSIDSLREDATNVCVEHGRALVLLGTCTVLVRGDSPDSPPLLARALIDSGAQDCFMTAACAKRLCLPIRRCNITVAGLGQNTVHKVTGITSCCVQPSDATGPKFKIQPIVMDKITSKMPTTKVPPSVREAYKNLKFADNDFDKSREIDLLLGAELFHNIYDGQRVDFGPGLPVALHSAFGWVITGKLDLSCRPPSTVTSLFASTLALDNVVKRFWEVEEPPKPNIRNPDDIKCEQLYSKLVYQNSDGRYVVPILLKESPNCLGNSYDYSFCRLLNLEKRLNRNNQLKNDYSEFMTEYQSLGHMEAVSNNEAEKTRQYVIPHHCVLRPESTSTKLRVVFDASAKSSNGWSLNDIVYTGPKLQNDIVDILTKFRLDKIVFTADICKMYRNIDLRPEDRKLQHVLWRASPADPVTEFELTTVTYGVSSSPYLAIRTLHQLANDHGAKWPRAATTLLNDTFMDDITAGAESIKEALELKTDLIHLLNAGKFELRKWSSNSPEFLAQLPSDYCQVPKSFCDESTQSVIKILGVQWHPENDYFTYSISESNPKCTKRAILSNVARIYDPLGWITPVVLLPKLLLQALWRQQLSWDETIPPGYASEWKNFVSELRYFREIRLPRLVIPFNANKFELIGFCDGSTKAYGCCIYLRSVTDMGVDIHLLIGKSKVAPLKMLTVNRLELCGAVLLARVMKHMLQLLSQKITISEVYAFTDSSTVLAWINTEPYKLKTFVAHRVIKITDDINAKNWHHVATEDNPADHCSRGLSCSQLLACPSWWSGPSWLKYSTIDWPTRHEIVHADNLPELKPNLRVALTTVDTNDNVIHKLLTNYSQFSHVQRVLAWCLRFGANLRKPTTHRIKSGLTTLELTRATFVLVRHEQVSNFQEEFDAIRKGQTCRRPVQRLNPRIDESGLLRVGGRLVNARLPEAAIHPLLLPKGSFLSRLIVDYYHRIYLHSGPRTLHSLVQRRYWILGIRNLIRSRLAKCVSCFKAKPIACQPKMGDLPSLRVQAARCFLNVGVDFAGPFTLKESRRRNARTYKAYVCVFVCLVVKAIHLELVTELTTSAFLAALDRFVSRRGLCKVVISDCGTNFVGAKRYLTELNQFLRSENGNIESDLAKREITWRLNPPTGSHFGGIFESGVKSMKYHLKRVVGNQVMTYEEFLTVLAKIEAVLNSRPLCAISSDPQEVDVLTPGHFLTNGPLVSLPEPNLVDTYVPPVARWKVLQKITQSFWRTWHLDYLHTLQQRVKWCKDQANIKIGDVVTIVEQNLPPLEWPVGRVEQLHPGADNVIRVVTLRTAKGQFRRPVTKLCPLPIDY